MQDVNIKNEPNRTLVGGRRWSGVRSGGSSKTNPISRRRATPCNAMRQHATPCNGEGEMRKTNPNGPRGRERARPLVPVALAGGDRVLLDRLVGPARKLGQQFLLARLLVDPARVVAVVLHRVRDARRVGAVGAGAVDRESAEGDAVAG